MFESIPFDFTLYSLPNFVVGIYALFLGVFVFFRGQEQTLNRFLVIYCASIVIWQISLGLSYAANSPELAAILGKISHFPVFTYAPTYYFICIYLTHRNSEYKYFKATLFISLSFLIVLLLKFNSPLYIAGAHKYFWGYYPSAGKLMGLEILYIVTIYCI